MKSIVCIELKLQLVHWTERETSDFRGLIVDTTGFSHFWIVGINDFVWSRLAAFLRSSINLLPLQLLDFSLTTTTKKKGQCLKNVTQFIWQHVFWKSIIWKIRTCSNKPDSSLHIYTVLVIPHTYFNICLNTYRMQLLSK